MCITHTLGKAGKANQFAFVYSIGCHGAKEALLVMAALVPLPLSCALSMTLTNQAKRSFGSSSPEADRPRSGYLATNDMSDFQPAAMMCSKRSLYTIEIKVRQGG